MNQEYIVSLAAPFTQDGLLTYNDFEDIFKDFDLHEQYEICDILYDCGIELVDELPIQDHLDESATISEKLININEPLIVKEKIHQSNEILCKLIQEGNQQAKQDLCIRNKNLVFKFAHRYEKYLGHDLTLEDLIQAGMIGIIKAADRFDSTIGCNFTTYAVPWIRQTIVREIQEKGFRIKIPTHFLESIIKIIRKDNELYLNGDSNQRSRIRKIADEMEISVKKVEEIISVKNKFLNPKSLDDPVNEDGDTTLIELIPSDEKISVEDNITFLLMKEQLEEVLLTLTPREMKILRLRFGLDDGRARTLEEVGQSFGVSRERIRQIEKKAMRKLRHPSRSGKLRGFLD